MARLRVARMGSDRMPGKLSPKLRNGISGIQTYPRDPKSVPIGYEGAQDWKTVLVWL
jgi:hypothetical protein